MWERIEGIRGLWGHSSSPFLGREKVLALPRRAHQKVDVFRGQVQGGVHPPMLQIPGEHHGLVGGGGGREQQDGLVR